MTLTIAKRPVVHVEGCDIEDSDLPLHKSLPWASRMTLQHRLFYGFPVSTTPVPMNFFTSGTDAQWYYDVNSGLWSQFNYVGYVIDIAAISGVPLKGARFTIRAYSLANTSASAIHNIDCIITKEVDKVRVMGLNVKDDASQNKLLVNDNYVLPTNPPGSGVLIYSADGLKVTDVELTFATLRWADPRAMRFLKPFFTAPSRRRVKRSKHAKASK
jgi:hypothetical protein